MVGMVVRQGLGPLFLGLFVGVLGALGLTRLLGSLVFEVGTVDLGVLAVVCSGLAAVAVFASWIPARRASRVQPASVLREE